MEDIREMAAAKFKPEEIKVLVYAVAPPPWAAKCWEITEGGGITELDLLGLKLGLEEFLSKNLPVPLLHFVRAFSPRYKAEHYLVVLWGHGEGIDWNKKILGTPGFKRFALGSQSALHLGELGKAMSNVESELGINANQIVVGFDSCLMSMVEVHYELNKSMGWAVAANDEIPDTGWPYTNILNLLKAPQESPSIVATKIAEECTKWYSTKINESNVSFSACALNEIGPVKDAVKKLRISLDHCLAVDTTTNLQWIREARDFAEDYAESAYVDLNAFCTKLLEITESRLKKATECNEVDALDKLKDAAREVCDCLKNFVIRWIFSDDYPQKYVTDSRAVSICFPDSQDLEGSLEGLQINWQSYKELNFNEETGWAEFIDSFLAKPRV